MPDTITDRTDLDGRDVLAAKQGDELAFIRLVLRHKQSLSRYLCRFSGNPSVLQDLRQETYLEVLRSLPNYTHSGCFFCWLRTIASRVGYRYWRCLSKEKQAQAACIEAYKQGVYTPVTRQVRFDFTRMNEVLSVLGQSDRALLEMRYIQGLKAEEIAQSLGWKVSRVRVRLHRARKRIRSMHSVMPDA